MSAAKTARTLCALLLLLVVNSCGGGGDGTAQPFTTLYCFGGSSTDALSPDGGLLQASDGNFYGTSSASDGSFYGLTQCEGNNFGAVYKIPPAQVGTPLHSFTGYPSDGACPSGTLIQGSDGSLYGMTGQGGVNGSIEGGFGTVFEITPEGVETILHSFSSQSDGDQPLGGLIQGSDGNFYGTTHTSGPNGGGTIFQITPAGVLTVLYSFTFPGGASESVTHLVQGSDGVGAIPIRSHSAMYL